MAVILKFSSESSRGQGYVKEDIIREITDGKG